MRRTCGALWRASQRRRQVTGLGLVLEDAAAPGSCELLGQRAAAGRGWSSQCGTRAAKQFSRQAYDSGVVIAVCPGCQGRHLLADRKGWFGTKGSVEENLAERGEGVVRKRGDGTEEILLEDLVGWSKAAPG
ncbi:hypothetical protein WJX81_007761 [Elliptochloris bilobata]|uniref:DNL-type domain-containing protein n=1 Tax=Elliptochloris bilobata TaxID=381761 RepID=A0AAW1QLD7_9CHLO